MLRGCLLAAALLACPAVGYADETSATDKLRILYSTRFTFTDDGLPLVTVEIMSGKKEVKLRAKAGITVRPDGAGGSAVEYDRGGLLREGRAAREHVGGQLRRQLGHADKLHGFGAAA